MQKLNLIKEQGDLDKIYFCAKDLTKPEYEFLIKKREDVGIQWMMFMRILILQLKQKKTYFNHG